MLHLRLSHSPAAENRHRVEISLAGDGSHKRAISLFAFSLSPQDEEDLRWYLEDFLQYPQEPAPTIARRIERRIQEVGKELFRAVFLSSDAARDLWAALRGRLPETWVEIVAGVAGANAIPWELLRDPSSAAPLALSVRSFVRAQPDPAGRPTLLGKTKRKIRILLIICRPHGEKDIPFRSVAKRLIKGLDETSREAYDLDVLRPPTFEQLARALRQATVEGEPYHAIHFDGHGTYREIPHLRPGQHGYLWFENSRLTADGEFVDGATLGRLLADSKVPLLILNACRSAHAEPSAQPGSSASDPHSQVYAFGSLAQEVMKAGALGVVAMRYNVYVVTAAQLMAELYARLCQGETLGEAVTEARRSLADNPLREVVYAPLPLQDWSVPVIYEAVPLQLFPQIEAKGHGTPTIPITAGAFAAVSRNLDPDLPLPPDAGFFGRDETILALDRAFDQDSIVLLHSYAGSGKTATAAEFARWYALTRGVEGPVLFTSFERYRTLPRVLDKIGQVFEPNIDRLAISWLALDENARRKLALQLLSQTPILWIWDNIEPIAGFPAGTESDWSPAEQKELFDFLRAAKETKAKFLLTSRRPENLWPGKRLTRIPVPPMPMTESLQLARALAGKQGRLITDIEDWRSLLSFAQGNPLTLTVLVGQVLKQGLQRKDQIEAFIAQLRAGEEAFTDEQEGRARSLGASLAYGFERAFNEAERKRLALLYLFQGFVDVVALCLMGIPENPACLPDLRDFTGEEGIALLDRAAEVGLLTAHGGGSYSIHPALPWFFKRLFEQSYASDGLVALHSFAEALGELGNQYAQQYTNGNREVISSLRAEEQNLLHTFHLALDHGWLQASVRAIQGLRWLYDQTSRRVEWKRLVEEIVPQFVDPAAGGPLPGQEEGWGIVTEMRVQLAGDERRWNEAKRLHLTCLARDRQNAAPLLARPVEELDDDERNVIRSLAVSLHQLGRIGRELEDTECISAYQEARELFERIGDREGMARCAFDLGHAFMNLPSLRDLDQAERWFRMSLALRAKGDRLARGICLGQCGYVATWRFLQARAAGQSKEKISSSLNEAIQLYSEALDLFPVDAVNDLAVTHNQLGALYGLGGDLEGSVRHLRQAISFYEDAGNAYKAAGARYNVAVSLSSSGRRRDALEYAKAALQGFKSCGTAKDTTDALRLIATLRGEGFASGMKNFFKTLAKNLLSPLRNG